MNKSPRLIAVRNTKTRIVTINHYIRDLRNEWWILLMHNNASASYHSLIIPLSYLLVTIIIIAVIAERSIFYARSWMINTSYSTFRGLVYLLKIYLYKRSAVLLILSLSYENTCVSKELKRLCSTENDCLWYLYTIRYVPERILSIYDNEISHFGVTDYNFTHNLYIMLLILNYSTNYNCDTVRDVEIVFIHLKMYSV